MLQYLWNLTKYYETIKWQHYSIKNTVIDRKFNSEVGCKTQQMHVGISIVGSITLAFGLPFLFSIDRKYKKGERGFGTHKYWWVYINYLLNIIMIITMITIIMMMIMVMMMMYNHVVFFLNK